MKKVMVVGAGFMGSGIAQVCAQAGYRVYLMDLDAGVLPEALRAIKWSLDKFSSKGFLKEPPQKIIERLKPVKDLQPAADVDWVIEAAFEEVELKEDIFRELDSLAPAATPLATNTSSIPITRLAKVTQTPERVLGLHFFGPVPFMGLVEVVKGAGTSEKVFNRGVEFVKTLGKAPVKVHVAKSDLILKMVEEGRLGRKVGHGFYRYGSDGGKKTEGEKL